MTEKPSFAHATRGSQVKSSLKRSACLNFRSKGRNMKRKDAIEFLKKLNFPLTKVFGIADMSKNTTDVTC